MPSFMLPLLCVIATQAGFSTAITYPVIIVPGDGGTQIQAKLTDVRDTPHYYCYKDTANYIDVWLSIHRLIPYYVDCFVHYMKLVYDPITHTTSNVQGVDVRINGWGTTHTIDWLDAKKVYDTEYFRFLSDYLEGIGYERGVSLRGVPYDFRKAANEMGYTMNRLKVLIENTYSWNGNKPCVLVAHSLGNLVTLYFLNSMEQSWKDKYVHAFVSLAAPWGGSIVALQLISSGYNFHAPRFLLKDESMRPLQRSMPSSAWLLPSPDFWSQSETLIETSKRKYTVTDYEDFFTDLNYPTGYLMWKDTKDLTRALRHPGVSVHCLHGKGVATSGSLRYTDESWPDHAPTSVNDDGDGTINIRSLRGCIKWSETQKQTFQHREYDGVTHKSIINDAQVFEYIKSVLT